MERSVQKGNVKITERKKRGEGTLFNFRFITPLSPGDGDDISLYPTAKTTGLY